MGIQIQRTRFKGNKPVTYRIGLVFAMSSVCACSPAKFTSNKSAFIASASVFGSTGESEQPGSPGVSPNPGVEGLLAQLGQNQSESKEPVVGGSVVQIGTPPTKNADEPGLVSPPKKSEECPKITRFPNGQAEYEKIDLKYQCSDVRAMNNIPLAAATNIYVNLTSETEESAPTKCPVSPIKTVVCSFVTSTLAADMLKNKSLSLELLDLDKNCPGLIEGKPYKVELQGKQSGKSSEALLITYVKKTGSTWLGINNEAVALLDYNPDQTGIDKAGDHPRIRPDIACDSKASPLVIRYETAKNDGPLRLSSPERGVFFDILGENSEPAPHAPKRISWLRSVQYLFITLPDSAGQVLGIDQMFGDNTKGPDGQFAFSGYEALAKYDGTSADGLTVVDSADGYIDASDAVYNKLRLWQDRNFDGIAQPGELFPMQDFGIARVDLGYDPSYLETDRWGNETRYKSVVESNDGRMYLLFDLWFNYTAGF